MFCLWSLEPHKRAHLKTINFLTVEDSLQLAAGFFNPIGLHMEVSYGDNKAFSRLALKREFQGWSNIVHCGVVATILDEIMAHAVMHYAGQGVTTSLQITYRAPLHVKEEFTEPSDNPNNNA